MVQVSYSTYGFTDIAYAGTLDQLAEIGFECVEFACDRHGIEEQPLQQAADIRRALDDRNMQATTVHAPARRNVLGASDEQWRADAVAVLAAPRVIVSMSQRCSDARDFLLVSTLVCISAPSLLP